MAVDAPQEAVEALHGVVSAMPGGGESRPGQFEMCEAVASALDQDRHLVVAAGTGTGKSMAYLAPLAAGGRKAVVATATKALQDQLVDKDLPLLAEALGMPLKFGVLKGRSNYVCRKKLADLAAVAGSGQQQLIAADSAAEAGRIRKEISTVGGLGRCDRRRRPGRTRLRAVGAGLGGGERVGAGVPGRGELPVGAGVLRRAGPRPGC